MIRIWCYTSLETCLFTCLLGATDEEDQPRCQRLWENCVLLHKSWRESKPVCHTLIITLPNVLPLCRKHWRRICALSQWVRSLLLSAAGWTVDSFPVMVIHCLAQSCACKSMTGRVTASHCEAPSEWQQGCEGALMASWQAGRKQQTTKKCLGTNAMLCPNSTSC